ncbi:MAG: CAP domain-containing protein [Halanaerobiaceae bacterium]
MKYFRLKKIALVLAFIIFFNIFTFAIFGSQSVQASFLDEHKGSILTVAKGFFMLWIINLMTSNSNDGDNFINSTINRALNLGKDPNQDNSPEEEENISDENISDENNIDETIIGDNNTNEGGIEGDVERKIDEKETASNINININEEEYEMLELVNDIRQEEGLKPLLIDMSLVELARKKGLDMVENEYFDHYSPDFGSPFEMLQDEDIRYSLAGENLAESGSIKDAFDSLMESPDHRDNILKARYDKVGIGVVESGSNKYMIVQLFIDSPDPTQ